jgi:hypothetical protein
MTYSIIDTATLRTRTVRKCLGGGEWSEPRTIIDLRGTPIGDKAEVWEWDRMVYPGRAQKGRRVREYITAMYCPEGWHSNSGTSREADPATCLTLLDPRWANDRGGLDRAKYHAHHDAWPVVWVIKVRRYTNVRTLHYCDPELPAEYRPVLVPGAVAEGMA